MTLDEFKNWAGKGDRKTKPLASPEVLRTGTEEDVTAAQERAEFKGRRKPKILYRKGDVTVEEVAYSEDAEGLGLMRDEGSPDSTILQATEDGTPIGNIIMDRRGGVMQIVWTMVKQGVRRKGTGKELLLSAVRKANQKGFELISDTSVSLAQLRVYESLRKSGQLVVEYTNPKAVKDFMEKHKDDEKGFVSLQLPTYTQPVVSRMFIPAYTETIRLRKEKAGPAGYSYAKARDVISRLLKSLPGLKPSQVVVVDSVSELPQDIQDRMKEANALNSPGVYNLESDMAYVILDNNKSVNDAVETFFHEAVAHKGLRAIFNSAELDSLLDEIYKNMPESKRAWVKAKWGVDLSTREGQRLAAEEYVATLAKNTPESTILTQIVEFIRNVLRKAGILSSWSDGDIHALLRNVRRELQFTPLERIKFTTEAEIEETGEIVTLEEAAPVALRRNEKRTQVLEKLRGCVA
jgi:predicted GNAT family acetyltransferase